MDYGAFGVMSNTVCPEAILTPATSKHAKRIGKTLDEVEKDIVDSLFIKRLGTPKDVALNIVFLLSDESSYITGSNIQVDGGALAQ
jgi:2-keto-3-deoxy-L-fuconate dehydrogenase